MRSLATGLLWVVTTILAAAAIPAMWAQQNLVSRGGYAALAQRAAADPALQSAMADELTTQVGRLGTNVDTTLVSGIAGAYTASSSFPGQFAQANAFSHRWLFTTSIPSNVDAQGRWVIDIAPMLSDTAFSQTLRDYTISVPESVPIPLTDNAPAMLRPGALNVYGEWGPVVSGGLAVLAAGSALVTLAVARRRGNALVALGVSGLLVGGSLWVATEFARRYAQQAAERAPGPTRTVVDVMAGTAVHGVQQWLTVTLVVGAGVVVIGVIVRLLGGVR